MMNIKARKMVAMHDAILEVIEEVSNKNNYKLVSTNYELINEVIEVLKKKKDLPVSINSFDSYLFSRKQLLDVEVDGVPFREMAMKFKGLNRQIAIIINLVERETFTENRVAKYKDSHRKVKLGDIVLDNHMNQEHRRVIKTYVNSTGFNADGFVRDGSEVEFVRESKLDEPLEYNDRNVVFEVINDKISFYQNLDVNELLLAIKLLLMKENKASKNIIVTIGSKVADYIYEYVIATKFLIEKTREFLGEDCDIYDLDILSKISVITHLTKNYISFSNIKAYSLPNFKGTSYPHEIKPGDSVITLSSIRSDNPTISKVSDVNSDLCIVSIDGRTHKAHECIKVNDIDTLTAYASLGKLELNISFKI